MTDAERIQKALQWFGDLDGTFSEWDRNMVALVTDYKRLKETDGRLRENLRDLIDDSAGGRYEQARLRQENAELKGLLAAIRRLTEPQPKT